MFFNVVCDAEHESKVKQKNLTKLTKKLKKDLKYSKFPNF